MRRYGTSKIDDVAAAPGQVESNDAASDAHRLQWGVRFVFIVYTQITLSNVCVVQGVYMLYTVKFHTYLSCIIVAEMLVLLHSTCVFIYLYSILYDSVLIYI